MNTKPLRETVASLRACIRKAKNASSPADDDEADDVCRNQEPRTPVGRQPVKGQVGESRANSNSSVSTGDGEGYMGTGAIINPDPNVVASDWGKANKGNRTYEAWSEHGKRMGLSPEGVDQGWKQLMNSPENNARPYKESIEELLQILGERGDWGGYYVPGFNQMSTPQTPRYPDGPKQALNPNDYPNTQAQAGGFGFRTATAWKVWQRAQELIVLDPLLKPVEILGKAVQQTRVAPTELTPEDEQLLRMAIDWLQSGPAKTNVRIGGTPGGPFRSTGNAGAP